MIDAAKDTASRLMYPCAQAEVIRPCYSLYGIDVPQVSFFFPFSFLSHLQVPVFRSMPGRFLRLDLTNDESLSSVVYSDSCFKSFLFFFQKEVYVFPPTKTEPWVS